MKEKKGKGKKRRKKIGRKKESDVKNRGVEKEGEAERNLDLKKAFFSFSLSLFLSSSRSLFKPQNNLTVPYHARAPEKQKRAAAQTHEGSTDSEL